MKSQRSIFGFTLIEVLAVIFLVGTLSAIAVPSWLAFLETCRLNIAQNDVYRALRTAQSKAMHEKLTWQASFREVEAGVQWAVHPATVVPDRASWNNLDPLIRLDTETTLEYVNNVRQIQFNYQGNVRKPPLGNITLSSKHGSKTKRCVYVSTILGGMRTARQQPRPRQGRYCY